MHCTSIPLFSLGEDIAAPAAKDCRIWALARAMLSPCASRERKHDPFAGVRVGEASNPGQPAGSRHTERKRTARKSGIAPDPERGLSELLGAECLHDILLTVWKAVGPLIQRALMDLVRQLSAHIAAPASRGAVKSGLGRDRPSGRGGAGGEATSNAVRQEKAAVPKVPEAPKPPWTKASPVEPGASPEPPLRVVQPQEEPGWKVVGRTSRRPAAATAPERSGGWGGRSLRQLDWSADVLDYAAFAEYQRAHGEGPLRAFVAVTLEEQETTIDNILQSVAQYQVQVLRPLQDRTAPCRSLVRPARGLRP